MSPNLMGSSGNQFYFQKRYCLVFLSVKRRITQRSNPGDNLFGIFWLIQRVSQLNKMTIAQEALVSEKMLLLPILL